jgi:transcriptional regulator with XRE-family HTH domain
MLRLRVKEVAEQQGLNQSQLQIKAGVNMGLLRRYWHNETSEIRFEPLEKIAHALGVKPEELLVSDEEESPAA